MATMHIDRNKTTESHYLAPSWMPFWCTSNELVPVTSNCYYTLHNCIRLLAQTMTVIQNDFNSQKRSKNNLDCQDNKKIEIKAVLKMSKSLPYGHKKYLFMCFFIAFLFI